MKDIYQYGFIAVYPCVYHPSIRATLKLLEHWVCEGLGMEQQQVGQLRRGAGQGLRRVSKVAGATQGIRSTQAVGINPLQLSHTVCHYQTVGCSFFAAVAASCFSVLQPGGGQKKETPISQN